jgi:two-component system CheB/CheR fusion protein
LTAETDPQFEALLEYLKEDRGFDFTGYKRASLVRRVQRRMADIDIDGFEEYHDHLLVHPEEFTALFNTILINVTGFFRDRDAWMYLLESVLPPILDRRDGEPVRAWTAGCASGEEAYTLAIVLAEALGADEFRRRVKIYATDVDEEALTIARHASYTEHEVGGVPDELREKYFERHGQRYVFSKELRRSVIFGRNDLVQDAPISHVDVLTCRNTLMYFNAETQASILQRMHFALRPDGVLFLGRAEMLLGHSGRFRPLEIKRRFFTKVAAEQAAPPVPTTRSAGEFLDPHSDELSVLRHASLMSSPQALMVLDREGRLVVSTNRASLLFGLTARDVGRPFQDLEVSYRPIELRSHIQEAMERRQPVWVRDVSWARGAADRLSLDIQVTALTDGSGTVVGTSIAFNDVTHYRQLQQELEFANRQLANAYEELQSTNEELETTNEELQSTVEELETTNEELQSTNEELETMNEELQSMNDELHMTSESHREQQEHFYRLNRFMSAVFRSMTSGVVVVDRDLHVLAWNAMSEELWGVRAEEAEGQPLFSLDIGLPLDSLRPGLKRLLVEDDASHEVTRLRAVNRRGRSIDVQVTTSPLVEDGRDVSGILMVVDLVQPITS